MPDVIVLDDADDDIFRNACWWAEHHSVAEAMEWETSVRKQLREIAHGPAARPLSQENEVVPFELRDAFVGTRRRKTYRALFTVYNETVYVLRVLDGSQSTLRPNDIDFPPQTFPSE